MMGVTTSHSRKKKEYVRKANFAGSWYESSPRALDDTIQNFLDSASADDIAGNVRALIVPHAGYSYSGSTAGYAYRALLYELSKTNTPIQKIIVLHPSHRVYLDGCAVSGARELATPLGPIQVDNSLREEILALSPKITIMDESTDTEEHSGEMQYPLIAKALRDTGKQGITILPIMCGSISTEKEAFFGNLLSPIVARADVLSIISSDFCHWGYRFRYQPTPPGQCVPIHSYIEEMDRNGMDLIQMKKPGAFAEYLERTRNTICGRHPISVWMQAIDHQDENERKNLKVQFVKYAQSSPVKKLSDSSVSYASAIATCD